MNGGFVVVVVCFLDASDVVGVDESVEKSQFAGERLRAGGEKRVGVPCRERDSSRVVW